ncbi:hypothetical protein [Pseudoalteromonas distincta]|uniref:Lipoprotein n=1 Tax=Pseudoalteromonas distincta TaxID=77608 RepID=A0A4P9J5Z7_9GAMM|nr:hypothetical protein [Pseudoalteromonas distincta]QCU76367.1 hypothetical protein FFU37_18020 [Pseudoalteromonas distincta]
MIKKSLIYVPLVVMSLFNFGCSSIPGGAEPPPSFNYSFSDKLSLSDSEKNLVLTLLIQSEVERTPFEPTGNGRKMNHSLLVNDSLLSYFGLNSTFKHQFNVKGEQLITVDKSERHGQYSKDSDPYCLLCDDFGFSDYIEKLQANLSQRLESQLLDFYIHKSAYISISKDLNRIADNSIVDVVGLEGILPKVLVDKLNDGVKIYGFYKNPPRDYYYTLDLAKQNYNLQRKLKLGYQVKAKVERLHYRSKTKYFVYDQILNEGLDSVQLNISDMRFNYIPNSFSMSDKSMDVYVVGSKMHINNKTNEYLTINSVNTYYDESNTSNNDISLVVPPKSSGSVNIIDLENSGNAFVKVVTKDQKVPYGFSVSYSDSDLSKRLTLFKINNYSIQNYYN